MESDPLVSIICPSYGHERVIADTIRGFLGQTYKNIEIFVIDDHSPDNTGSFLRTLDDSRIKLLANGYNMGVSNAMNSGIRASSGEVICFCASDDILMENHVESVVDAFRARKHIGAVFPRLQYFDENDRILGLAPVSKKNRIELLREMLFEGNGSLYAPGSAYKRGVFDTVGLFNPSLVLNHDYDMNVRVLLRYEFYLLPEVTVKYRRFSASSNLSGGAPWIPYCYRLESSFIFDNFLTLDSVVLYNELFEGLHGAFTPKKTDDLHFCLAAIAAFSHRDELADWGFGLLMRIMREEQNWEYYHTNYDFDFKGLITLYRQKYLSDEMRKKEAKLTLKKVCKKAMRKMQALLSKRR